MDSTCQNTGLNAKYLLGQLNTARKEINNLRQQIKALRYIHEKDVDNIKRLINLRSGDVPPTTTRVISSEDIKPSTSTDDYNLNLKPIGIISTWFPSKRGTPRQTGICGKVPGKLELYNTVLTNPEHALEGLQDFSHMWILFYFHRNDSTHVRAKVAPPRLNGTRTGVFSTRSPHRPCPIGLSLVRITGIENNTIYFEGVDMVDQSPVLDIKPYIPQYDSPAYFEKLSNRSEELNTNDSDAFECIEESASLSRRHMFDTSNADVETSNGFRALIPDSYGRKCLNETDQETDISRDEEIALRLQTEEFQGNPNFENYSCSRRLSQLVDINFHNDISSQDEADVSVAHRTSQLLQNISSNVRAAFNASTEHNTHSSNSDLQSENLSNVSSRLQSINLSGHNNDMSYPLRSGDSDFIETHTSRNSRLLDGADGPSTVCGTDSDLIHRCSLNSRIDNSPVRMGIREAPDGEEGLESQALTPSQTLSNIQVARTTSNSNLRDNVETNSSPDTRVTQHRGAEANVSEVRVPEWVSRPRAPLCVVFNDRALIQLNEILGTKINDQKKAIENVLREDPRSVYLRQRWGSQFYTFLIHDLHITCRFDDNRGIVTVFQVRHAGRICECGEPEWQCLGHSALS